MMGSTRVGCMWSSNLLGEKMGNNLIANSHTICLFRVPGLEEGVMFGGKPL